MPFTAELATSGGTRQHLATPEHRVAGGGYANALSDYHGFAGSGFEEPQVRLAADSDEHFIQMLSPLVLTSMLLNAPLPDLRGEHWTKYTERYVEPSLEAQRRLIALT